tara:strand:- start:446 stop:778 length:333 start_codon:yes stop_codon:yes gene_type:complete
MTKKVELKVNWGGDKYYPKHFKTKGEEFLYKLGTNAITDKHLQLLIDKFPSHRYINQMRAEQARRAKCRLNSKKAKESTEKTQWVGVCQLIRRNANSISTFISKMFRLKS